MEFTAEEISLCKQIAEKHRKEITRGDWYVHDSDEKNMAILSLGHEPLSFKNLIPLWSITDCLEFLRKHFYILRVCSDGQLEAEVGMLGGSIYHYGKTPLEACLKAVLAVLKEGK